MSKLLQLIASSNNLTVLSLVIAAAVSLLCGVFIYYIYRRTYSGVYYSRAFNRSLVLLMLVTTFLIRVIAINPLLTLGMVGAVSIVRYRTAVKEPMDAVFMLWAVVEGIVIGSGKSDFIVMGVVSTALVGVVIFFASQFRGKDSLPYMLIVRHDMNSAGEVTYALRRLPRSSRIKSRTVTKNGVEVIVELRLPAYSQPLVSSFQRISGVFDAELVEMHTDYAADAE